jgi:hypothetical protein
MKPSCKLDFLVKDSIYLTQVSILQRTQRLTTSNQRLTTSNQRLATGDPASLGNYARASQRLTTDDFDIPQPDKADLQICAPEMAVGGFCDIRKIIF